MRFLAGVGQRLSPAAQVLTGEDGVFPTTPSRELERQTANSGRRTHVMKSAMNQAGRDHEKMTAAQIHRLRTRELVGRSTVEQKEQLKALMRVPRDAAGEVAADPADVDEHLQLDLVSKHVNRFFVHTSSTSDRES